MDCLLFLKQKYKIKILLLANFHPVLDYLNITSIQVHVFIPQFLSILFMKEVNPIHFYDLYHYDIVIITINVIIFRYH